MLVQVDRGTVKFLARAKLGARTCLARAYATKAARRRPAGAARLDTFEKWYLIRFIPSALVYATGHCGLSIRPYPSVKRNRTACRYLASNPVQDIVEPLRRRAALFHRSDNL